MARDDYIEKNPTARRSSLALEVANKLVDFIQNNNYQPGDRIPSEFELADQFDVGRGTIREAVKLLTSRNVLEIRPAKGTFVCETPGITEDPLGLAFVQDKVKLINDLLELRIVLESYAIRNASLRATPEQIRYMRQCVDAIEENKEDNEVCVKNDIAFHQCIAESSGNSVISIVLPIIRRNMQYFNSLSFEREWDLVNRGHYAMIEAIEMHNPMLAEVETLKHLSYVSDKMKGMG